MATDPSPTADATRSTAPVPDVAGGEHAGCAGFEQVGFPRQGPAFGQVWAGEDEAPLVAGHRLGQPLRERLRADQDEQPIGGLCLGIAGVPAPESELLQAPRTAAVMERAGISPDRRVGGLGARQREQLLAEFAE
jgi:hypothetical protein